MDTWTWHEKLPPHFYFFFCLTHPQFPDFSFHFFSFLRKTEQRNWEKTTSIDRRRQRSLRRLVDSCTTWSLEPGSLGGRSQTHFFVVSVPSVTSQRVDFRDAEPAKQLKQGLFSLFWGGRRCQLLSENNEYLNIQKRANLYRMWTFFFPNPKNVGFYFIF